MLRFSHFWWGYLPCNVSSKQTDLHALNNFSSSIDKVSFKKNSMSLGLVVLEKKLFTRTRMRTPTPQSDDIKMGDYSERETNESKQKPESFCYSSLWNRHAKIQLHKIKTAGDTEGKWCKKNADISYSTHI